jgi:hypothetical protein
MRLAVGLATISVCAATIPALAVADGIHLACDGTATGHADDPRAQRRRLV